MNLKKWMGLFAMLFLVMFLAGCSSDEKKDDSAKKEGCACGAAKPAKADAKCACADMKTKGSGWCDHCGGGMVAGKATACKDCATAGKVCAACEKKAAEAPKKG